MADRQPHRGTAAHLNGPQPSATVPARFAKLGDLHQDIDGSAHSLDTLLEWAERYGLD